MSAYWSDRIFTLYNKAKEKSREIRVPSYIDSPKVNNQAGDFSMNSSIAENLQSDVSRSKKVGSINRDDISPPNNVSLSSTVSCIKYTEPFASQSKSEIPISHSTYMDFNISQSNCFSTASVTLAKPQNEIPRLSSPINQIKKSNDFNSVNINLTKPSITATPNDNSVLDPKVLDTVSQINSLTSEVSEPALVPSGTRDLLSPDSPEFIPLTSMNSFDSNCSMVFTSQSTISHPIVSNHISSLSNVPLNNPFGKINPKYACIFCFSSCHNSHNCQKFSSSQEFWDVILTEKKV